MSKTRSGPAELAAAVGDEARRGLGAIRRMAITLTSEPFWQVLGHLLLDGTPETRDAAPFVGIGIAARPPTDGEPEAIVVFGGNGARSPIIAAARDEKTRRALFAIAGELAADEVAIFNSGTLLHIKANGELHARAAAGTAEALALHRSLTDLKEAIENWTPVVNDGGAALKTILTALIATGWPFGTTKLHGQ
jgi:hypothetical protein